MTLPEGKIIKAACRTPDGEIHTGWRHAYIRDDLIELGYSREDILKTMHDKWATGFITENGRYLPRHQALLYGRRIGQVGEIKGAILTSEDLWDNEGNPLGDEHADDH